MLGEAGGFPEVCPAEPGVAAGWGFVDELFVDGKSVRTGPPPSYEKIHSIIAKRVRKLT